MCLLRDMQAAKIKSVNIILTEQRKLSRGNKINYLDLSSSDGAQDLSGGKLLYSEQFHSMNLHCVCDPRHKYTQCLSYWEDTPIAINPQVIFYFTLIPKLAVPEIPTAV